MSFPSCKFYGRHIGLEALGIAAVFVHEVQMLNASIATSTADLPFSEEEKVLLRIRSRSLILRVYASSIEEHFLPQIGQSAVVRVQSETIVTPPSSS